MGDNYAADRTDRGSPLLHACAVQELVVENSIFSAGADSSWTRRNGQRRAQLDYILLDRRTFAIASSSFVAADVDIGSDHRPVFAELAAPGAGPQTRRRKRARRAKPWQPSSSCPDILERYLSEAPRQECNAAERILILH
eukprot:5849551-Pyramimonas_sp.AAC.1